MEHILSLPVSEGVLSEYENAEDLAQFLSELRCEGLEIIRCDEDTRRIIRPSMVKGLHLPFHNCWLDFWRGDQTALTEEFGDIKVVEGFYGDLNPKRLVQQYKEELKYAEALGAEYVVFHISEVTINGVFTNHHRHTDEAVIDAAAEIINESLSGGGYRFDVLMENLWWPGFNLTNPEMTRRLLERVDYPDKGIMLDIGHLLHTNPHLTTQEEACSYVEGVLENHGELWEYIKGIHMHQTLEGAYAKAVLADPPQLMEGYYERFTQVYEYIGRVDAHQPFNDPAAARLVERINPRYLVHELAAGDRAQREQALSIQRGLFG
jgi:hypothetical protein